MSDRPGGDAALPERRRLELERLRWRSRRGLLEMDLVLTRFMERRLEQLDENELRAYAQLLQESDTILLDYVNGRAEPDIELHQHIVALWRDS